VRANEVRQIEQTAAWDRMESKQARRDGGNTETAFVTSSYVKQLSIQKEHEKGVAIKE
jgi:hypothetical protein